jgi:kumamolisin
VAEIIKAYDADKLGMTGKNQTIALLIDTEPDKGDMKAFWNANKVNGDLTRLTTINVNRVTLEPPSGEETLDAQWTSGIAPDAKIRIYASGSLAFVDLDQCLAQILEDVQTDPTLRQLSISLGLGETYLGGPLGEVKIESDLFLKLAAVGVNVFISSGDAGSNPGPDGHNSTGPVQVEYQSSDPSVIGVGGTRLTLKATGAVNQETAWPGSGGGKSALFKRPAWQQAVGVPAGAERCVPDVSMVADPGTGAYIYLNGQAQQYGGTSWSAPVWAGFCALMNEGRDKAGKPKLPYLNPQLYTLPDECFRDITLGTNGKYHAGKGYDLVTGLGVPNVGMMMKNLK